MAKREELESVLADVHTLDSKIGLIASRIKQIEQNEEVIGRTLIALNNRLRALEEKQGHATGSKTAAADSSEMEKKFATKGELAQVRYTLDMINPLQFATLPQIKELLDERLARLPTPSATAKGEPKRDSKGIMERI